MDILIFEKKILTDKVLGTVERMRTTPGRRALPIAVDVTLVRRHLTTYTGAQGSGFPSNCAEILEISWIFLLVYSILLPAPL